MAGDPVDDGGGHLHVAEDRAPATELQVGGDRDRLPLVGVREHLEQKPGPVGVERQEPQLVDHEQPRAPQLGRLPVEPVLVAGPAQAHHQRRGREEAGLQAPFAGQRAQRRRHVGLAGAHVAISTRSSRRSRNDSDNGPSRPSPSGHATADHPWPSKVLGAGRAQRLGSSTRLEASRLARSASRRPARRSTGLGAPSRDHPSSTAVVSEHDLPASSTRPEGASLAAIGDGGADLLFQPVGTRYEGRSTIVTTNVGVGGWARVFGDEVAASAIADRLCHHCRMIKMTGRSYRLKDLPADSKRRDERGCGA